MSTDIQAIQPYMFDTDDITSLPYTLRHPLLQAHKAYSGEKYGKAMNHMLDFFEISSSFCSYIFLRLLLQVSHTKPGAKLAAEQFVNRIDQKRPLSFGDWLNDLFTPLLAAACKFLPEHPLTESFAANIYMKHRNILLGNKQMQSIVQIRNEYRGHTTTLSENIYHGVADMLMPRICMMIDALRPLSRCSYSIDSEHYIINFDELHQQIDLYPLVYCDAQDYRYVLLTLKDEQTCYVAANENAVTKISYGMNKAVDKALQEIVPSFDIAQDLNWTEIRKCMQEASGLYLKRVYAEKKYNEELFVERASLSSALMGFYNSGKTLFPLIGEAGQGKTTQLAYWTERLIEADKAVLTVTASDFVFCSLDIAVKRQFGFSQRKDIRRLVDNIHDMAETNGQDVYIFVDALNECLRYADADEDNNNGPLLLYRALCNLFIGKEYRRFKVLFTCRNYTWANQILPYTDCENGFVYTPSDNLQVRGFCSNDAQKAYHIYQQLYQMHTPYDKLDPRIALRLRDPLTLKIASGIFLGKDLTATPAQYTSIALYNKLYEDITNSYAGNRQRSLLELMGDTILESYMAGEAKDCIAVSDIRQAISDSNSPYHKLAMLMYRKDGVSIAYAELLHKAERPMLKEVERQGKDGRQVFVQFIYERFLEYVIGRAFVKKFKNAQAEDFIGAINKCPSNVVFLGALRNALLIACTGTGNFDTLIELERRWGDDFRVMSLVNDTISTMISENYEEELFALLARLIGNSDGNRKDIEEFNSVVQTIQNNAADTNTIERHKTLSASLAPVMRLKKLASVSLVNGVMLSDYFNEQLYTHDALGLLWQLLADQIYDVRNDTCMYIYYLSKRTRTNGYEPLKENLTVRIIKQIYANIRSGSLVYKLLSKSARTSTITNLETATRLAVLLIIDNMLVKTHTEQHTDLAADMLAEIKSVFRYLTANLYLVKAILPVLQVAMKRQVTFQSDYVNNAMEYQTFWEKGIFDDIGYNGASWKPEDIISLMTFGHHHVMSNELTAAEGQNAEDGIASLKAEEERWRNMHDKILSAYKSGDSLSYFVIERIMIIMGVTDWNSVAQVIKDFFTPEFRKSRMFDYSQMSMLYILYQIGTKSGIPNRELLDIYTKEATDWTLRLRGLFKGHRSEKANTTGKYKRNVMSWYAAIYCTYAGECKPLEGDTRCVPAFYRLIDEAFDNNDRELMIHLVENIMELVTDMDYYDLALDLLKYIMQKFDSKEKISRMDGVRLQRSGLYEYDIVKLIGNVLGTAKNYCPERVNAFIQRELTTLPFPGVDSYQESILNYNPSGESLQDVLTHKFGNFLIVALLDIRPVDDFAIEAINAVTASDNSFAWFEQVVKILIRHLFGR